MSRAIAILILLACSGWRTVDSLERAVADADLVVRGTITKVTRVQSHDGRDIYHLDVVVHETLKGAPRARVDVAELTWDGPTSATDVLVFLVDIDRADPDDVAPTRAIASHTFQRFWWGMPLSIVDLAGEIRVVTNRFETIDNRDALLARARKLGKLPSNRDSFTLPAPDWFPGAGVSETQPDPLRVAVPIDSTLEKHAHVLLKSILWWDRKRGLEAIVHFKTAANIRRVTALLADPDAEDGTYPVRERAREVLDRWK